MLDALTGLDHRIHVLQTAFAHRKTKPKPKPLRILFAGERWLGSDAYAFERAFQRAGHAVLTIDSATYLPRGWRSNKLRALRRAIMPVLVREYEEAVIQAVKSTKPHLFVGFKAPFLTVRALNAVKKTGAVAINIYPDVSVMAHGPRLPRTLPRYDWVFTTKSFGVLDMHERLQIENASFFPPAFDPELHRPMTLSVSERARFSSDISFIGTWSPKKEAILQEIKTAHPNARLRIWGTYWDRAKSSAVRSAWEGHELIGPDFTKAICASKINLGLLSEKAPGASQGDLITHRTIAIPACSAFMLHEETEELATYFKIGREIAAFSGTVDLNEKITFYLGAETERRRIAAAGRTRVLAFDHSVDRRVKDVIDRYELLSSGERHLS